MSLIESINQELIEVGFTIDDNMYTFERTVQTGFMVINGVRHVQEQKQTFLREYIGDGCEVDNEGVDIDGTHFCGFDLKDEGGYSLTTVYVKNLDELRCYINI